MWAAVALVLMACAGGCAVNPVSGRHEIAMVSRSTELELGAEQAKAVEQEMGLITGADIEIYVRGLGARLAAASPRQDVPYAFHVVDMAEPNAFAIPGHVYVTRGLLVLANDEDELAGVLAHEIAHIAARHAVQHISRALPAGILTGLVSGVTGLASPALGGMLRAGGELATGAFLAPYSRDQEREADRVGQEIVARAGWDPAALSRVLATLERAAAFGKDEQRRPSFFDSHPSTPERVEATAAYAATLSRAPRAATAEAPAVFLRHLDGLVVGQGAANGIFEQTTFLHPDLGFHVRFPDDWKTANGRSHVVGATVDGRAGVVLTIAADGDDPMAGVRAFEKDLAEPVASRVEPVTLDGRPALHLRAMASTDDGRAALEIWWTALGGHVFQLTGVAPAAAAEAYRSAIEGVARSFGPLGERERDRIRELRLRLVDRRPGETLAAFAARSQTAWKPELIAIVNGGEGERAPTDGALKVAIAERYRGAR